MKLIKRGAEADIYQTVWRGADAILKIRAPKKYRNPVLDARLRRQRTAKESQMISYVKSFGAPSPLVYFVDHKQAGITMQMIPGTPVHDLPESEIVGAARGMGRLAGMLHKNGVMHGDLTTSNFILLDEILYIIDFGLSQNTIKPEDHAVDLRLIKEILNSAHAGVMEPAWNNFLAGYEYETGRQYSATITRLVSEIEGRGRYARVV